MTVGRLTEIDRWYDLALQCRQMTASVRSTARALFQAAVDQVKREGLLPTVPDSVPIERPKRPEHGDYATNVALALAKTVGKQPRALAEIIVERLRAAGLASKKTRSNSRRLQAPA